MDLLAIIQDRIKAELTTIGVFADHGNGNDPAIPDHGSILQMMTAVWEKVFDRIAAIWPRGFLSTPEIRAAEIEVERVQALVLSGKATLEDFQGAAESWEQIVNKAINIASPEKGKAR